MTALLAQAALTLLAGSYVPQPAPGETREFRYVMGTSVQIAAIGADEAYRKGARGLEPEATYLSLMARFDAPWPPRPLNVDARRKAGFSEAEIARLEAGKAACFAALLGQSEP